MVYSKEYTTMIECKNYNTTLPKKELIKFVSDIKSTGCSSAIMISSSAIPNKRSIDFEIIDNKIPVFYIHNNMILPYLFTLMDCLIPTLKSNQDIPETKYHIEVII